MKKKEYIKYEGKVRLLRCGCNDEWSPSKFRARLLRFPDPSLFAAAGIAEDCPECGFCKWVRLQKPLTK